MSTEKPTDEDYSRDLHADLAIAEAATKGPWAWEDWHRCFGDPEYGSTTDTLCAPPETGHYYRPEDANPLSNKLLLHDDDCNATPEDQIAIASNRQAAPAAMRRAIEAEEAILEWYRCDDALWDDAIERLSATARAILAARKGGGTL